MRRLICCKEITPAPIRTKVTITDSPQVLVIIDVHDLSRGITPDNTTVTLTVMSSRVHARVDDDVRTDERLQLQS